MQTIAFSAVKLSTLLHIIITVSIAGGYFFSLMNLGLTIMNVIVLSATKRGLPAFFII